MTIKCKILQKLVLFYKGGAIFQKVCIIVIVRQGMCLILIKANHIVATEQRRDIPLNPTPLERPMGTLFF